MSKRGGLSKTAKSPAYQAWGRILKLAHDLERVSPGAGELFLRRMARTLDQARSEELCRLRTLHDREDRSA